MYPVILSKSCAQQTERFTRVIDLELWVDRSWQLQYIPISIPYPSNEPSSIRPELCPSPAVRSKSPGGPDSSTCKLDQVYLLAGNGSLTSPERCWALICHFVWSVTFNSTNWKSLDCNVGPVRWWYPFIATTLLRPYCATVEDGNPLPSGYYSNFGYALRNTLEIMTGVKSFGLAGMTWAWLAETCIDRYLGLDLRSIRTPKAIVAVLLELSGSMVRFVWCSKGRIYNNIPPMERLTLWRPWPVRGHLGCRTLTRG